jgi:hypothetical protein
MRRRPQLFQRLEEERLEFLKNSLLTYVDTMSQTAVNTEQVRCLPHTQSEREVERHAPSVAAAG